MPAVRSDGRSCPLRPGCPAEVPEEELGERRLAWDRAVGQPHVAVVPRDAEGQACYKRRRLRGKQAEWQPILPPVTASKLDFPKGRVVEMRNRVVQEPGTIRLYAGRPVYTDGSAQMPGTSFAVAAAAVWQEAPDGSDICIMVALGDDAPRSAIAGEMQAFALMLELLGRGFAHEDGVFDVHIDFTSVISAYRKPN